MKVRLNVLRDYLAEHHAAFLIEGRVEDARDKFPDMEDENFDYLVANQPAGSNNKYLMWACKQADELLENDPDPQGLRIVIQAVRLFDGNKQRLAKKDLNQYKDTTEIEAEIEKLGGASKNQQAKQARAESDVIFNDDQFMVLRPHTTEASCKYGVGTKWCIAATASKNYFNQYSSSNNKFYFVIDKKAQPNAASSKFAIVIQDPIKEESQGKIQVFDATDRQVGLNAVINHTGSKWQQIWQKIQEHATANPITREVEDAQKAVEEHVKALLNNEKVSKESLERIAKDANLTTPIILKLIERMREYSGPYDYSDPRNGIISALSERASSLTPEGAIALIKYLPTTQPPNNKYWYGKYQLENIIKKAPLTPQAFAELVETGEEMTITQLVINPSMPHELLQKIATKLPDLHDRELKKNVYRALMRKGTITPEQMRDAVTIPPGGRSYDALSNEIITNPELSAKLSPELLRMVHVNSGTELKIFLQLPNVPPDLSADLITKYWKQLSKEDLYELLKTVKLPTDMIEKIWTDNKGQNVRIALLQNPAIGVGNVKKFATSKNSAYRFAVAHNTALPAENLQTMAGDESASTRAAVASNTSTPAETLKVLAGDEATVVRASVASNAKTPVNVLNAMKRDSDDFVRKSARKTLKSLETTETFITMAMGMHGHLLTEEISDDDETPDIMIPRWRDLPTNSVNLAEFIAIVALQNNGSASREEIESAFSNWPGRPRYYTGGRYRHGRRLHGRQESGSDIWALIRRDEKYADWQSRSTSPSGKGWFWSPPGITKGSIYRLTGSGAAAAVGALQRVRDQYDRTHTFNRGELPPVKKSPAAPELNPNTPAPTPHEPGVARAPKTTYKVYGKFKGHPVATRLKGQAYVGANDTQFRGGEQAIISPEDGKLRVKKADSDHSQLWDPIDG